MRALAKVLVLLAWVVLIPTAALAQAVIAGTVKDSSGAVLPGVTVEASSPALIEKVRTAVTDGTGQYRVEDLRPGTYTVTMSADRVQRVQARRDRADRLVHGDDQRRPEGRRGRRNHHRHRRNAGGRRAERAPRGDDHERRAQVDPDGAQLQRHRQRRAGRHDQPERRRHHDVHHAVSDPRRTQQRRPHDGGRPEHRQPARRQPAAGVHRRRRQRPGSHVHDRGRPRRIRNGRPGDEHRAEDRRQLAFGRRVLQRDRRSARRRATSRRNCRPPAFRRRCR